MTVASDCSGADHAHLNTLLGEIQSGEVAVSLTRKGTRLADTEHDQLMRHLVYLDFAYARKARR